MRLYSENVLRDTGKMLIDSCKLIFISAFVTNRFSIDVTSDNNVTFALVGVLCYLIGATLVRLADRMVNQKEERRESRKKGLLKK